MKRLVLLVATLASLAAAPAFAQDAPALWAHHFTLNAGLTWSGPYDVGDATAQLRGNATGPSAPAFALFTADSRVSMAFAPEVHAGFAVTRYVAVDGGISFSRPRIGVAISGDPEAPSQQLAGEQLDQYQLDARLTWQLPIHAGHINRLRLAPFASIGGGYLRQLHEDRALGEAGWVYFAGGGARYWLRGGSGSSKDLGVRADARINVRTGGIDFENKVRTYPSVTLSLFIGL